jgi:hypothetical protein
VNTKGDPVGFVGVPEIWPVVGFSVRPAGSVPAVTLHVIDPEPPVCCNCTPA